MPEFVVHSVPGSPFGRAVFLTFAEKGVLCRLAPVAPANLRSPEHMARHPFGRIPVLDHGDFRLYETQAILRYLDRVLPYPSLTPADPRAAARMDQAMNVGDWYVFQGAISTIGFQRIVRPRVLGQPTDEAAVEAALPRAQEIIDTLAGVLGEQRYFSGDTLSLADLHIVPHLDMLLQTPEWDVLAARHARLRNWMERMTERPSMAATTPERLSARAVNR